jgi:transposase
VDIGCKTVERAHSDSLVRLIIHNMFVILVKRKGITQADLTGDGTGYSLTFTKHYRSLREKAGEAAKSNEPNPPASAKAEPQTKQEKKELFTYAMYVGYGASFEVGEGCFVLKLHGRLCSNAAQKPRALGLDQFYAGQSTAFGADTAVYVIPKSDTTIRGSFAWKDVIRDLIFYPFLFLSEYFMREHSESGFSADKRCDGWKMLQR